MIYRVGGFNVAPSPAFLFRVAQHAERLVIAYANGTLPTANEIRRVTTLEGVPVPPHLQGKIFAVGSERHLFLTYDQSSDLFIEQLECMRQRPDLLAGDALTSSATVITSSGGGLDSAITRCRLQEAGFHRTIGTLVISGSMFDYPVEDPLLVWYGKHVLAPLLGAFGYADVLRVAALFTRHAFQRYLGPEKEAAVDLSVGSVIGPPVSLGRQPFKMAHRNIRPVIRALVAQEALLGWLKRPTQQGPAASLLCALRGGDFETDGVIPLTRARLGGAFLQIQEPHDHVGLIEDPAVADAIIRHLQQMRCSVPAQVAAAGGRA